MVARNKIGSKTINNGLEKYRAKPLEDEFKLSAMVQYDYSGVTPGAFLLKKKEGVYQIKFGFECSGIHPIFREESIGTTIESLEAGLKDLPDYEDLTIHLSCFRGIEEREQELVSLLNNCQSQELKYLLMGEMSRLQELNQQGIRKNISVVLYCTYTVEERETKKDPIAASIKTLEDTWYTFIGQKEEKLVQNLAEILDSAYKNGFIIWEQLLSNKLGLPIRALNAEQMWGKLWQRFNHTTPIEVPQYWHVTPEEISEVVNSQVNPVSLLLESESSVPVADRQWVYLKDKYITANTLSDKPAGWKNALSQLRYIWDVLKDDRVYDTEVIFEMRRANQSILFQKMQSLAKQAIVAEDMANDDRNINVSAGLKKKKAIDAQEKLYEGSTSFHTALVFLVHREYLEDSIAASNHLSSKFLRPAWLLNESEYVWHIWLQTVPIYWGKLMAVPFDRRLTYLNGEAPGLMPLVKNRSFDRKGFELIAAEGGTPMYIDLYDSHKNIFLLAKKRKGKSVNLGSMINGALLRGIPVMTIDYPDGEGRGSFSAYSEFLGSELAAYFNISESSSNLFELPDLAAMNPKKQSEKLNEYFEYLSEILLLMVMGIDSNSSTLNTDTVRAILVLAIEKFYNDLQVKHRIIEANTGGFGSAAWQKMPTLVDFESFLGLERLELTSPSNETVQTINQIKLRLRYWINSRVGKAIANVSTFRSDAPFLCVAMTNLSNPEDAAVLASVVFLIGLRRTLGVEGSVFAIDEASIFCQYDSLAKMIAKVAAGGAKSKIRLIIASQEPNVIAASPYSPSILQNMDIRLIGKIDPSAIDSFEQILKIPRQLLLKNVSEGFGVHKSTMHSDWLLDYEGVYTHVRYFAPYNLLAALANNSDEAEKRNEIMSQYDHPIQGLQAYSQHLLAEIKNS